MHLETRSIFSERFFNILEAKKEIDQVIGAQAQSVQGFQGDYRSYSCDVLALPRTLERSVDYIFTDPPYGGHIAYLDLSTLWNVWVSDNVDNDHKSEEIIVGGSLGFSEEEYTSKLGRSIEACCAMLKQDRWMSVVFQHSDPKYFAAILDAAAASGAEIRAAVSQVGDTVWSMHKKKNGEGVLGGEFILTFFNSGKVNRKISNGQFHAEEWLRNTISRSQTEVYAEALLNGLILEAWKKGSLDSLTLTKEELNEVLKSEGYQYDSSRHSWRVGPSPSLIQPTFF